MQGHIFQNPKGFTGAFSRCGLAIGSAGATIDLAAPNGAGTDFAIDGYGYHKADTASIAITAHAVQAALYSCLYLVQITSGGTVSTKKGDEVLTADVTAGRAVLKWPEPDADNCPLGGYRVDCASGYTYTNGTTLLSATGITDTYYNFVGGMPATHINS